MLPAFLEKLITEKALNLAAYKAEHITAPVSLHANENPYPPSPELLEELRESLVTLELNRYPDPDGQKLKASLSEKLGTTPDHLVLGNGSDELIQLLIQVFCDPGDRVAFPDPTFSMYSIIARGLGVEPYPLVLSDQWDFKAPENFDSWKQEKVKIVFFSYPNNPTGNCFSAEEIQKVLNNFEGIIVLDEAYYDFARKTFLDKLKQHPNLILLRSLSKIGLAGLRVGYGIADPCIIRHINKMRLPYNLNSISQFMTERLLARFSTVEDQVDILLQERERMSTQMVKIKGIQPYPSDSNFILFKATEGTALHQRLLSSGVLIRNLVGHPRLKDCLRVTVGTPEQNDKFLSLLASE